MAEKKKNISKIHDKRVLFQVLDPEDVIHDKKTVSEDQHLGAS